MTTWRMAFRVGNQGAPMWKYCLKYGVAAITYKALSRINLSNYKEYEPNELWKKLSSTQKRSLHRVAYEMKLGDIIYVKQGPKIISKGKVTGKYHYDTKNRIIDKNKIPWSHQIPVKWETDFPEIEILLGAEQLTVKELSSQEIKKIEEKVTKVKTKINQLSVREGDSYTKEIRFRIRNQTLIRAKKEASNYKCEVCGFKFESFYGDIGKKYIIAHHIKFLSKGPRKTTFDDIALLCANCHVMVHTENPPMSIRKLKKLVSKNS